VRFATGPSWPPRTATQNCRVFFFFHVDSRTFYFVSFRVESQRFALLPPPPFRGNNERFQCCPRCVEVRVAPLSRQFAYPFAFPGRCSLHEWRPAPCILSRHRLRSFVTRHPPRRGRSSKKTLKPSRCHCFPDRSTLNSPLASSPPH